MKGKKQAIKQIREFLKDSSKKKVEITVPKKFKLCMAVNPFKLAYRTVVLTLQKGIVPLKIKNCLLRSAGIKMGSGICIPHYICFDKFFPELISIGDGSLIGGLSKFYTHKLENGKLTLGRIDIKDRALIAGMTTINPGVTINSYAITGMSSTISEDVPERGFVVAKDRLLKTWSDEELERHFGESKNESGYYKDYKSKTKDFRKNKSMMIVKIRNNGKSLNPGNEWYLSRPWLRVFYNAVFVEIAQRCPCMFMRKLLYRIMGAKIGKNVHLGKGVILDHIYGDLVNIGDNVHLGDRCYLDCHSYTLAESVYGRIKINEGAVLEDDVYVYCGVTFGKNCKVLKGSSVLKDIPDGETWSGMPAKPKPVEEKKEQ